MAGFIIGMACLAGLVAVVGSECRRRRGACGGPGAWHGWHGWHGWGEGQCGPRAGRWGRYWFVGPLLERLETTPGQEKAIRAAIDELLGAAGSARQRIFKTREQLAAVFRSGSFDETLVAGAISGADEAVDQLRKAVVDGLAKVYGALDERQRGLVAEWLERSPGAGCGHGPYRSGGGETRV